MSTYLLSWKASEWEIEELEGYLEQYNQGNKILRWSSGQRKNISKGEYVYLMKKGTPGERGLFGAGKVVSDSVTEAEHFSDPNKTTNYVNVEFDYLVNPTEKIIITRDILKKKFPSGPWDGQGGGQEIDPNDAEELRKLWLEKTGGVDINYPDEVGENDTVLEGAKTRVTVNSYERDKEAKVKCTNKHGVSCVVCGFHFQSYYGELGKDYIHAHHLVPIASIGEEYELDPIEDLRPVCPNCHAMLHRAKEPVSISDLEKIVETYGDHPRYEKVKK